MTSITTHPTETDPSTAAKPARRRCAKCGCESPLVELYSRVWLAGWLCPSCRVTREIQGIKTIFSLVVVFWFLAAIATRSPVEIAWRGGLAALIWCATIVLHEAAHVVAGVALGGQWSLLHFGLGPIVLRRQFGALSFSLARWFAAGGLVVVVFRGQRGLRWRYGLMIIAPLLLHLLLFAGGQALRADTQPPALRFVLWSVVVINGLMLAMNIWPTSSAAYGSLSDGGTLWRLWRDPQMAAELDVAGYTHRAFAALRRQEPEAAVSELAAGRRAYPDHSGLRLIQTAFVHFAGSDAAAYSHWRDWLAEPGFEKLPGAEKALIHNNVAWAALFVAEDDHLAVARHHAEQAFSLMPWLFPIQGTLGAVQLEQGEVKAGLARLYASLHGQRAHGHPLIPVDEASLLAYIALCQWKLNDEALAREYFSQARSLNPEHALVQRVAAELGRLAS